MSSTISLSPQLAHKAAVCVQFRRTSFLTSTGHYCATTVCGLSESDRACVVQCEAGCRWWYAECLGSCEMATARVQVRIMM